MTFNFDATQVQPITDSYTPLPNGEYTCAITAAEYVDNSKKNGKLVSAEFTVLEGEHEGRKIFHHYNMVNPNEQAQQIGHGQLSATCHAIGQLVIDDLQQLLNKPLIIKVKVQAAKGEYPEGNKVTDFKPAGNTGAAPAANVIPNAIPPIPQAPVAPATTSPVQPAPQPAGIPPVQQVPTMPPAPTVPPAENVVQQPAPVPTGYEPPAAPPQVQPPFNTQPPQTVAQPWDTAPADSQAQPAATPPTAPTTPPAVNPPETTDGVIPPVAEVAPPADWNR